MLLQGVLFVLYLFDFKVINIEIPQFLKLVFLFVALFGILVLIVALLQLNKNLSPFPTPKTNSQLVKHGLYKFVRHPIYTGLLLLFFGYAFYSLSAYRLLIAFLLLLLFFLKSRYEEQKLIERFSNYQDYKLTTGRFFPKVF